MSKALIKRLRDERESARKSADTLLAKMESGSDLSEAESSNLEALVKSASDLDARIADLTKTEMARMEAEALDAKFDQATREFASVQVTEPESTSLADAFVNSEIFANYAKAPAGNSGVFESSYALIKTEDGSGNRLPGVARVRDAALPVRTTPLLDALGYEPVSSNSIDWIEWPLSAPVAGVVLEGAVKPEATYAPALRAGTLDKIAHHIPITREALEDIARARAIVSGALLDGVRAKAEADAAAALVAATLPTAEHETLLGAIRVGVAECQMAGFQPRTVVVNPLDYAEIDIDLLTLTLNGARRESPVWGLTVVPAGAVAAGTAYVGDFNAGMTLFDRQVTSLYITDSHASEFTSNILRLLAEARMKSIVTRPEAIVECSKAATP
jgi:hypothetical protein